MQLRATRPAATRDLSPSKRSFVSLLQELGFGHLQSVRIRGGAVVLDPWPTVVKLLKFGAAESPPPGPSTDFELKKSMADFFEYIRGVDDGEIRCLEIRHGLPFSMEVEHRIPRGYRPDISPDLSNRFSSPATHDATLLSPPHPCVRRLRSGRHVALSGLLLDTRYSENG